MFKTDIGVLMTETYKAGIQRAILKMLPLVILAEGFILIATNKKYKFLETVITDGKFCILKFRFEFLRRLNMHT